MECRLNRAKQWAQRLMLELPEHNRAYFITLTYNEDNLPINITTKNATLRKADVQKFFKSFRQGYKNYKPGQVKYFYCGEYGDKEGRPHYHIILYCENPIPDLKYWSRSSEGEKYYRSETIEKIWTRGQSIIGEVTEESANYVRRYITKKQLGQGAEVYNLMGILPPYVDSSNGLNKNTKWEMFYINDEVYVKKKDHVERQKPAKFFDKKLEEIDPEYMEHIKKIRLEKAIESRLNELKNTSLTEAEYREMKAEVADANYKFMERNKI